MLGLHSADVAAAAVRRLPDLERAAVALAFFADHSYRDVARLMQLPEGTTKSLAGVRCAGSTSGWPSGPASRGRTGFEALPPPGAAAGAPASALPEGRSTPRSGEGGFAER